MRGGVPAYSAQAQAQNGQVFFYEAASRQALGWRVTQRARHTLYSGPCLLCLPCLPSHGVVTVTLTAAPADHNVFSSEPNTSTTPTGEGVGCRENGMGRRGGEGEGRGLNILGAVCAELASVFLSGACRTHLLSRITPLLPPPTAMPESFSNPPPIFVDGCLAGEVITQSSSKTTDEANCP